MATTPSSGRDTSDRHALGSASQALWWRQAAVYQVYPRSFADADGDGVGDLRGLASRVGHLRDLGVDALWLSPFYPSALADGGYDVDDHRDVDPRIGTLAQFDLLVDLVHSHGMRLLVDIVPNHTSDRHVWFAEARAAAPGSPARDRYVIRPGRGADRELPPSDWVSAFGGPAWHPLGDGEWYLHMFAPEQPDLNWDNPTVRQGFLDTLRFWADRGVDGFRVDVAHLLAKDLADPLPSQSDLDATTGEGRHRLQDRDEVHAIYREWRRVFDEYDPPRTAVAEAWVPAARRARYARADGLGQAFNFDLLQAPWDLATFRSVIGENLRIAADAGTSSTWVLSNHDVVRHVSRYALPAGTDLKAWLRADGREPAPDLELGRRRARAATLLTMALPGAFYLYQGEELGLPEVADLPSHVLQDPTWRRSNGTDKGRDGCRVPLPWTPAGPSFGFGPGGAHLPQPAWFSGLAVERQQADPGSTLALYVRALAERRRLRSEGELTWNAEARPGVLQFTRPGGWVCATNFGDIPVPLPDGRLVVTSGPLDDGSLPPDTTVWLEVEDR